MNTQRIQSSYRIALAVFCTMAATVSKADDLPVVDISSVVFGEMFEGNPNDLVRFEIQRSGNTDIGPFNVSLTYSGTASINDFTAVQTITFDVGETSKFLDLQPVNDTEVEGRETIVVSIAPGTAYQLGTNSLTSGATAIIVDDDVAAGTTLYQESFDTDVSANWTAQFGSLDPESQDYSVVFGFDYSQPGFEIPPAPHSNGDTLGLLVSVNKLDALAEAAGVNLYLNGKDFSGNYAVRFDMYLMQNVGSTEYAIFGIDHNGGRTNWFSFDQGVPTGWTFDGNWAAVASDLSTNGDYLLFSSPRAASTPGPTVLAQRSAASLADVFHQPPWSSASGPGLPSNLPGSPTPSWAEVELRQVNGVVTLSINNTNIVSHNATSSTHGTIMLGYNDPTDSIGSGGGGIVIFDNLRVVSITETGPVDVHISTISRDGNSVQIDFTAGASDLPAGFQLVTAATVVGPYSSDSAATITSTGAGAFRATATSTDTARFYQIQRKP